MRPPSQKITPIFTTSAPGVPPEHHRAHPLQIPPNSRTGRGRVRAMSMVAVRHSPILTLGAQGRAFCMSIGGVDVRLFGEKWMLVGTVDRFSFGTAFAARLVTTILVIR